MFAILLTVHLVLCMVLIGLVLLQQGKGADMGAAFGGGSNTVFGASGATDFITKVTTYSAILFMVTSILLVREYVAMGSGPIKATGTTQANPLAGSVMDGVVIPKEAPANTATQNEAVPQQAAPLQKDANPATDSTATTTSSATTVLDSTKTKESATTSAPVTKDAGAKKVEAKTAAKAPVAKAAAKEKQKK